MDLVPEIKHLVSCIINLPLIFPTLSLYNLFYVVHFLNEINVCVCFCLLIVDFNKSALENKC